MRDNKPSITAANVASAYYRISLLYPELTNPVAVKMSKLFVDTFLKDEKNFEGIEPAVIEALKSDIPTREFIETKNKEFLHGVVENAVARKTLIEGEARRAISEGLEQIINCGAGGDSLLFRLSKEFPNVLCIEDDHPATQVVKLQSIKDNKDVLGEIPTNLKFISHDLEKKDGLITALKDAGYDPNKKTLFIFEGVFHYLEKGTVVEILEILQQNSKIGSKIIAGVKTADELTGGAKATARLEDRALAGIGESYKFSATENDMMDIALNAGYVTTKISPYHAIQKQFNHSAEYLQKLSDARGTFHVVLENVGREVSLSTSKHQEYKGPVDADKQIAAQLNSDKSFSKREIDRKNSVVLKEPIREF